MRYTLLFGTSANQANRRGFSSITLLITAALISLSATFIYRSLNNSQRIQRGIASNDEMAQMSHFVRMLTESAEACQRSGLIDIDISPLLTNGPSPSPIPLSLGFTGNSHSPVLAAGKSFGATRKIEGVYLTSATLIGSMAARTYFATLQIQTSVQGQATTVRNPNLTHFIKISTNTGQKINACWGNGETGGRSQIRFGGFIHRCPFNYDPATYNPSIPAAVAPFAQQRPRPDSSGNQLTGTQECAAGFKPQLLFDFHNYYCNDMFYYACAWSRDYPTVTYPQAASSSCTGPACASAQDPVDAVPVVNNTVSLNGAYKWRGCGILVYACTSDDRKKGDVNGDGIVDMTDFFAFRTAYGTSDAFFDFDGDGTVGLSDFFIFRNLYGM